ncbi:hypothetical protein BOX15_Mlig000985g5, partial [Macrostomum lignano]
PRHNFPLIGFFLPVNRLNYYIIFLIILLKGVFEMSDQKPILPPKPGQVRVIKALYNYAAQAKDELSFDAGDILYLVDSTNKDWYTARCGSSVGLIPSNYVEEQTEAVPQPMHSACQYGNLTFLAELIDNKVSVNGLDAAGNTALHWASRGGHAECVRLLLMAKCDANAQNKSGDTALHLAAWKSHSAVVELLLFGDGAQVRTGVANASLSVKNRQGETPLAMAKDAEVKAALLRAARLLGRTTSATEVTYSDSDDGGDSD